MSSTNTAIAMEVESSSPNGESNANGKLAVMESKQTENEDTPVVKNGETSDKENSESSQSCSCKCGCQLRLEELENEMKDLKIWKVDRLKKEDAITNWKDEVNKWMESTFGFIISASLLSSKSDDTGMIPPSNCENDSKDQQQQNAKADECFNFLLNTDDTENVEITPDLFGHFLLDNEYSHDDESDDDVQEIDQSLGEEEESESEVPNENIQNPLRHKRNRRYEDDSDSECYTLDSSSSTDMSSSGEEEYEPQRKRGRGRGRGNPIHKLKQKKDPLQNSRTKAPLTAANSSTGDTNSAEDNSESRKELLKHCRKRQGNIWECTVCGFMLTSFENMCLHIKYNHSSSTHTCPYCRIVVLCRSPKDAVVHQAQCKMRSSVNSNNNSKIPVPAAKIIKPVQPTIPTPSIQKTKPIEEIHAEIDKLVADLLEPSSSGNSTTLPNNNKKTETPAIVTLSSDED